ncbi:flagellar biosynthetic protein FliO [Microbacterium sp. JZ31]|uniref:flagellar biosynthetic protein FliO n=1 Tax=Microbacterium sp. JZ31 TaxID=1906274 RepID=UPI00193148A8|nr:flagellar biosynthetic protein FliO [Microbacterium sp. JZ31]
MLGALWYLQRRLTRGGAARRRRDEGITVVSRQALGGKAQLVVVEVEGTRYVLGVSEQGVSVVDRVRSPHRIDAGAPRTERSDVVGGFERLLAAAAADAAPVDAPPRDGDVAPEPVAPLRRDRRAAAAPADPLHGSILSPGTWRQTARALRRVR